MSQDLNRRKDDRHPTQPLQWDDKPDLLAMRAGVNEIQREIERARLAGLTMLALPIETANAACCYVAHLGERVGESVGAAPAEQASKQVPSRLDIMSLIREQCHRQYIAGANNDQPDGRYLAEIEAAIRSLAGQPAAPVAATEQAKDTPESMANSNARFAIDGAIQYGRENRNPPPSADHWLAEYWNIGRQLAKLGETGWDNVTPLATPADAGAGEPSTDERMYWQGVEDGKLLEREVARLSTPAAPVTAEPVALRQAVDAMGRAKKLRVWDDINHDLHVELDAIFKALDTMVAAPVSPQPAAQVPSIDRDSVRNEACAG